MFHNTKLSFQIKPMKKMIGCEGVPGAFCDSAL